MPPTKKRPYIYAHRGSSLCAPENTLAAFILALEQGADGIELDVKLSSDGELVVIHDQTVNRTTQGNGRVSHLTLEQLRSLDAGSWKDSSFAGEKIPTLAEVFETVGGRTTIMIELTNYLSIFDNLPQKVVQLVQKYKLEDSVIFSSFLPANLAKVRRLLPEAPLGNLLLQGLPGRIGHALSERLVSVNYCQPHYTAVSRELVEKKKQAGKKVNVWTVNTPELMHEMIGYGVDGLITDNPQLALGIREQV